MTDPFLQLKNEQEVKDFVENEKLEEELHRLSKSNLPRNMKRYIAQTKLGVDADYSPADEGMHYSDLKQ